MSDISISKPKILVLFNEQAIYSPFSLVNTFHNFSRILSRYFDVFTVFIQGDHFDEKIRFISIVETDLIFLKVNIKVAKSKFIQKIRLKDSLSAASNIIEETWGKPNLIFNFSFNNQELLHLKFDISNVLLLNFKQIIPDFNDKWVNGHNIFDGIKSQISIEDFPLDFNMFANATNTHNKFLIVISSFQPKEIKLIIKHIKNYLSNNDDADLKILSNQYANSFLLSANLSNFLVSHQTLISSNNMISKIFYFGDLNVSLPYLLHFLTLNLPTKLFTTRNTDIAGNLPSNLIISSDWENTFSIFESSLLDSYLYSDNIDTFYSFYDPESIAFRLSVLYKNFNK
jgi:hypothetical protein